jgi:hypothetical protein
VGRPRLHLRPRRHLCHHRHHLRSRRSRRRAGWCRAEYFVFSLWSAIIGSVSNVQLYAAATDGTLKPFKSVEFDGYGDMPEQGDFSVETDRATVKGLQEQMIAAFGHVAIRQACEGATDVLDLNYKMLQDQHVPTLAEAVKAVPSVKWLYLGFNQMTDISALAEAGVAGALPSVRKIELHNNKLSNAAVSALAKAIEEGAFPKLDTVYLDFNPATNQAEVEEALAKRKK